MLLCSEIIFKQVCDKLTSYVPIKKKILRLVLNFVDIKGKKWEPKVFFKQQANKRCSFSKVKASYRFERG